MNWTLSPHYYLRWRVYTSCTIFRASRILSNITIHLGSSGGKTFFCENNLKNTVLCNVPSLKHYQCCGAETFCFRSGSGSDFQKVSVPAPTLALYLFFITNFILKSGFFMFSMKEYQPNSHAGFYTIWIFIFIFYSSWPGAGARSRSRNFDIPAPAPQNTEHYSSTNTTFEPQFSEDITLKLL
jgi:hypothetical protein